MYVPECVLFWHDYLFGIWKKQCLSKTIGEQILSNRVILFVLEHAFKSRVYYFELTGGVYAVGLTNLELLHGIKLFRKSKTHYTLEYNVRVFSPTKSQHIFCLFWCFHSANSWTSVTNRALLWFERMAFEKFT